MEWVYCKLLYMEVQCIFDSSRFASLTCKLFFKFTAVYINSDTRYFTIIFVCSFGFGLTSRVVDFTFQIHYYHPILPGNESKFVK